MQNFENQKQTAKKSNNYIFAIPGRNLKSEWNLPIFSDLAICLSPSAENND
jgi:hypothetical protein